MSGFDETHDPGLQQERTVLAWDRTGLALMVVAGILVRIAGETLVHPINVVAAGPFSLGLALLVRGRTRYLTRRKLLQQNTGMLSAGSVVTVAAATVLLGASALFVVLVRAFG